MTLDERSRVSLYVAGALGAFLSTALVTGTLWIAGIEQEAKAASTKTTELESRVDRQGQTLKEIREIVIRIDERLKNGVK